MSRLVFLLMKCLNLSLAHRHSENGQRRSLCFVDLSFRQDSQKCCPQHVVRWASQSGLVRIRDGTSEVFIVAPIGVFSSSAAMLGLIAHDTEAHLHMMGVETVV